jgi:hypothetical protein
MAVTYGKYNRGYGFSRHDHTKLLDDKDLGMPYQDFIKVFPTAVWPKVIPILPAGSDFQMYNALKIAYNSEDHPEMRNAVFNIMGAYNQLAEQQRVHSNDALLKTDNRISFLDTLARMSPKQLLQKAGRITENPEDLSIFDDWRTRTSTIKSLLHLH